MVENTKSAQTQILTLQSQLSTHQTTVQRELAETQQLHVEISQVQSHRDNILAQRNRLKTSVAATNRAIESKLEAQREYARKLESQTAMNTPELDWWEKYLGCRIEGAGRDDYIRITYAFPPSKKSQQSLENRAKDHNDADRDRIGNHGNTGSGSGSDSCECVFELRVPAQTSGSYEVVYTSPKLESSRVDAVVGRLNETREIAVLLKGMRGLFAEKAA